MWRFRQIPSYHPVKKMDTIAKIVFTYNNKEYKIEYNFGDDYPTETAEFIFTDGNYSCDCNRSIIINEKYHSFPITEICGNNIKMIDFQLEFK